jgi:hypothetical protein
MKFSMDRYQFEVSENKVVATSMHAGKTVSGVAKCDPEDEFSLESGKRLAAARCNEKVYNKRMKQARKKLEDAIVAQIEAQHRLNKAYKKFYKAQAAYDKAVTYTYRVRSSL